MSSFLQLINADLGYAQATVAGLTTIATIGVVFLRLPSRASLYWSYAFMLAFVSTFGVVAGQYAGNEGLRTCSLGLLLGAPALLWSGFREYRDVRSFPWTGPVISIIAGTTLLLLAGSEWFAPAYRVLYLVAALTAGLFFWEWRRLPQRADPALWPLAVVSLLFVALGIVSNVVSVIWPAGDEQFALTRPLSSLGMLVYLACACVAVVGISTRRGRFGPDAEAVARWREFTTAAQQRLATAQAEGSACSILSLWLDDVPELRATAGPTVLSRLNSAFRAEVERTVEPPALVGANGGEVVVVVPQADPIVRDLVRRLLRDVADLEESAEIPGRVSASAGWASTSVAGYDLDALLFIARRAARIAQSEGGDRWQRADGALIERLVSGLER